MANSTREAASPAPRETSLVDVAILSLDNRNPRLPEELLGADQWRILEYLFNNGELDELARSMLDNGFFQHEPIIIADRSAGLVVLEGNRRLATLMVLHGLEPAQRANLAFAFVEEAAPDALDRLRKVPCFKVASEEDVHSFLGFRHIGGIKTWSAEAKARYIWREADRLAETLTGSEVERIFSVVGRRVGSNAQGVRNPYIAIRVLVQARDEFGLDVKWIQHHRFGVWTRLMNSPDLRWFIGFGDPRSYPEVLRALSRLQGDRLRSVVGDLTPNSQGKAVLADSRDVTVYSRVLVHDAALAVLRQHNDLRLAEQVIDRAELGTRVRRVGDSLELLIGEVQREDDVDEGVLIETRRVSRLAKALAGIAAAAANDQDED